MSDEERVCACGHDAGQHQNRGGRCSGESYDDNYDTTYACLCPYYTEEKL